MVDRLDKANAMLHNWSLAIEGCYVSLLEDQGRFTHASQKSRNSTGLKPERNCLQKPLRNQYRERLCIMGNGLISSIPAKPSHMRGHVVGFTILNNLFPEKESQKA